MPWLGKHWAVCSHTGMGFLVSIWPRLNCTILKTTAFIVSFPRSESPSRLQVEDNYRELTVYFQMYLLCPCEKLALISYSLIEKKSCFSTETGLPDSDLFTVPESK